MSGRRGELGGYTFAGGFRAGFRGRGIHLPRGRGLAAWLHLTPDRRRRTARRRRGAGGRRPTPPPASLRTSLPRSPTSREKREQMWSLRWSRDTGRWRPRLHQSRKLARRRSPSRGRRTTGGQISPLPSLSVSGLPCSPLQLPTRTRKIPRERASELSSRSHENQNLGSRGGAIFGRLSSRRPVTQRSAIVANISRFGIAGPGEELVASERGRKVCSWAWT